MNEKIPIHIQAGDDDARAEYFVWEEREKFKVASRILRLRDDQIAALLGGVTGLKFYTEDIEELIREFREDGHRSAHLETLMTEGDSKEILLWWIEFFEKHNREPR